MRLFGFILCLCISPMLLAETVVIATASNFSLPLNAIKDRFEVQTGYRARIIKGASGKLYAQIRQGAPFDVFLSADTDKPLRLDQASLGVPGSRMTYAIGRLALWSPDPHRFSQEAGAAPLAEVRRLAIANPKVAPYGKAAKMVMTDLDIWHSLEHRLVYGENIAQTFQFVITENADAGFVALSQVWFEGQVRKGSAWLVPESLHLPIEQDALWLKRAVNNPAARAFMKFLRSQETQALIESFGYSTRDTGSQ